MEHVGRGCGAAVRPGPIQPILRLPRTGLMPAIYPPQARPAGAQVLLESERAERAGETLDLLLDLLRLDGAASYYLLLTTHYPLHYSLLNLTSLLLLYFSTYCSLLTTHNSPLITSAYRRRPRRWSSSACLPTTSYIYYLLLLPCHY